jgi:hypothetical protein
MDRCVQERPQRPQVLAAAAAALSSLAESSQRAVAELHACNERRMQYEVALVATPSSGPGSHSEPAAFDDPRVRLQVRVRPILNVWATEGVAYEICLLIPK